MKTEKNPQRQNKTTKDLRRPERICKHNKSNNTQDKNLDQANSQDLKDALKHKRRGPGGRGHKSIEYKKTPDEDMSLKRLLFIHLP